MTTSTEPVDPARTAPRRIVVGVDGSDCSRAALAWALRQAALTGADRVAAVIAWEVPYAAHGRVVPDPDLWEASAREAVARTVAAAAEAAPPVRVEKYVVEGHPVRVLLDAAHDAELLVVGARGRGGFTGTLLGSVSQACARHAPCPVVVVRG
jgi:nucleotide-binding universal stress UspA family protein